MRKRSASMNSFDASSVTDEGLLAGVDLSGKMGFVNGGSALPGKGSHGRWSWSENVTSENF